MNGSMLKKFVAWIHHVFHCEKIFFPGMWEHLDKEIERPTGVFLFPSITYCTGRFFNIRTTLKLSQGDVCALMVSEEAFYTKKFSYKSMTEDLIWKIVRIGDPVGLRLNMMKSGQPSSAKCAFHKSFKCTSCICLNCKLYFSLCT